ERLTEFVVALSRFGTGELVAERGVERTAEALDAEVAALVRDGRVAASYGWPRIEVPEGALLEVAAVGEGALPVPGGPPCPALRAAGAGEHQAAEGPARAPAAARGAQLDPAVDLPSCAAGGHPRRDRGHGRRAARRPGGRAAADRRRDPARRRRLRPGGRRQP